MKIGRTYSLDWTAYELIDAGTDKKLERWGELITIRPERQAYFKPGTPVEEWKEIAHLEFIPEGRMSGKWIHHKKHIETPWEIQFQSLTFQLEPTKYKHIGLFPEQITNWKLINDFLQPEMKMLNLFAYTGAASIVGRSKGADVTHVDSVKSLLSWGRKNMELSGLEDIRWVHDDAIKFANREVKRGNTYDLIVMDPPSYGVGVKNEKWKIEHQLESLIETASKLLKKGGLLILNTYSPKMKEKQIHYFLNKHFKTVETSELWKKTYTNKHLFYGHLARAYK